MTARLIKCPPRARDNDTDDQRPGVRLRENTARQRDGVWWSHGLHITHHHRIGYPRPRAGDQECDDKNRRIRPYLGTFIAVSSINSLRHYVIVRPDINLFGLQKCENMRGNDHAGGPNLVTSDLAFPYKIWTFPKWYVYWTKVSRINEHFTIQDLPNLKFILIPFIHYQIERTEEPS